MERWIEGLGAGPSVLSTLPRKEHHRHRTNTQPLYAVRGIMVFPVREAPLPQASNVLELRLGLDVLFLHSSSYVVW